MKGVDHYLYFLTQYSLHQIGEQIIHHQFQLIKENYVLQHKQGQCEFEYKIDKASSSLILENMLLGCQMLAQ